MASFELFGNGSKAAKALTSAFASGDGSLVAIATQSVLVGNVVISGDAADAVEFEIQWLDNNGQSVILPASSKVGNTIEQLPKIVRVPGSVGSHAIAVTVPYTGYVRFLARSVGSAGTTNAVILCDLRQPAPSEIGDGGGSGGSFAVSDDGVEAFGDGAGSALALTNSYVAGSWIDVNGFKEIILGLQTSGVVGSSGSIDVKIEWRSDSSGTAYTMAAINKITTGQIDYDEGQYIGPDTNGDRVITREIPRVGQIRISAKFSATVTAADLFVEAFFA